MRHLHRVYRNYYTSRHRAAVGSVDVPSARDKPQHQRFAQRGADRYVTRGSKRVGCGVQSALVFLSSHSFSLSLLSLSLFLALFLALVASVIATITIVLIFVVAIPLVLITAWAPWICEGHKTRYLWEEEEHKLKREREETGMTWAQQRRLMAGLPASVAVPAGLVNTDPTDGVDTSSPIGRKSVVRRVSVTLSPLVVAEQRRSLAVSQAESIAANWKQFSQQDEKKQHHCYWANTVTHKTTWSKPECLVEAEKEEMVFNAPTSTSLNDPSSLILKTKQKNKKSSASAVANPVAALARGKAAPIAPPPGRRRRQKEKKLPGTIQLGHIAAASIRVSVEIPLAPPSSSSTLATQAALFEQMVHAYGSLEQERMVVEIRADPQHFLGDPRPLIQTIARHFAAGTSPLPASGTLENCGSFAAVHALPTSEVVDGLIATVREEGGAGEGEQRQERQRPRVRGPSSIV